jgi:hypothetical protein
MVDGASLGVCKLRFIRNDLAGNEVGSAIGTGFFWVEGTQWYIVTNWHNVTGVDAETNCFLGKHTPNKLIVSFHCGRALDERQRVMFPREDIIDLYKDGEPIWMEHPNRRAVDCAAIPFDLPKHENLQISAINRLDWQKDYRPRVGAECFVIGYPKGLAGAAETPIWKRASIATEPAFDHGRRPVFLVDTATRKGMSGSPVIARHHGVHFAASGDPGETQFGTVENLVGIYSGRVGDDQFGVQLGIVWKIRVVEEIMTSGVNGIDPAYAE